MSLDATQWAWQQRAITPTQKLVLLSMADRAGENHDCWPSIARLSLDTGLSDRAVQKNIKELVEKGLLRIEERRSKTNKYILVGVAGREDSVSTETPCSKADPDPLAKAGPTAKGERRSPRTTCTPNVVHPERGSHDPRTTFGQGVNHVHPNLKRTKKESLTRTRVDSPVDSGESARAKAGASPNANSDTGAWERDPSPDQLEKNRAATRTVRERWLKGKGVTQGNTLESSPTHGSNAESEN